MYPLALGWGSAEALPFSTHLKPEIYINSNLNSLLSLEEGENEKKKTLNKIPIPFPSKPNIQFVGPQIDHSSGFLYGCEVWFQFSEGANDVLCHSYLELHKY